MGYLPKLPYSAQRKQSQILQFRGTNLTDNYPFGSVRESLNITTDRFPYIASRNARDALEYINVSSISNWDKLIVIQGTSVYIDGTRVAGSVYSTPKQFAVVNTKLVIWPDKVYIEMSDAQKTIKPLGCKAENISGSFAAATNTLTVTGGDISGFKANDVVLISGCSVADNNRYLRIYDVTSNVITFDDAYAAAVTDASGQTGLGIDRDIPDMDYICASENRLWGCSSKTQTIYASALGDPTNFYTFSNMESDSYVQPIGTDGDFTGCSAYSSSVLFWKEEQLHKVLGSNPSEYQVYTYNVEGVKKGCDKSLCNINDTLFYVGLHGVHAFSGGAARKMSEALGGIELSNAAAGSDGERYYLSAQTGDEWNLWVYSLKTGLWIREDDTEVIQFTRIGDVLYGIKRTSNSSLGIRTGYVFIFDNGEPIDGDTPWSMTFAPFMETVSGSYNSASSIFAKKRYGRMHIRVELPEGSYIVASVRMDGGRWYEAGRIVGEKAGVKMLTVPIKTCDRLELKLEGKGPFCILNMQRTYTIGSER